MYLKLNKEKMELNVICGVLENYKPSKDVKDIHRLVSELKAKMDEFMDQVVDPELIKINAMIQKENEKYIVKESDKE